MNGYVDAHKPRILGKKRGSFPISKRRTFISFTWRICLAPFALALSLVLVILLVPCDICYFVQKIATGDDYDDDDDDDCGGCGLGVCVRIPWFPLAIFDGVKRKTKDDELMQSLPNSETPGLEAASWVQLLMNYQSCLVGPRELAMGVATCFDDSSRHVRCFCRDDCSRPRALRSHGRHEIPGS